MSCPIFLPEMRKGRLQAGYDAGNVNPKGKFVTGKKESVVADSVLGEPSGAEP